MRLPKDKKTRINIYFISPFILVGLIFGGLNLYKKLYHSTFTLTVSKDYPLSQSPDGFIRTRASIAPRQGQLFTYGGGHSPSDLMLYLPPEKVLFIGDIAFVGYHPAMKDGNPEQWIEILDKVLELDFETIVAGHGLVGDRTHVEQTKQYLKDLILKSKSRDKDDTVASIPSSYNEWRGQSVYYANLRFLKTRYGNK